MSDGSTWTDFVCIDQEIPKPKGWQGGSGGGIVRNSDPQMHVSGLVGDNDDEGNSPPPA